MPCHAHPFPRLGALPLLLAALGAAHSALGQAQPLNRPTPEHVDEVRQAIREGRLDIRHVVLADVIDEVVVGHVAAPMRSSQHSPLVGNPNPWAPLIGPTDFHEGFESYTKHTSLASPEGYVPLEGQVSPDGGVWMSANGAFYGVVDNAIAQTGPNWNPGGAGFDRHGVLGGPDPLGERSAFFAAPRGSIEPQAYNQSSHFAARLPHPLYAVSDEAPVLTILIDLYIDDKTVFTWWRPVSLTEGLIVTNIFVGGWKECPFNPILVPPEYWDQIVVLAGAGEGEPANRYYMSAPGHTIREREWMTLAVRLAQTEGDGVGMSVWVRDSSTVGVYGFADDSLYDAFPGDPNKGAFAGEIFREGWLQVMPGLHDDPDTPLLEGNGPASNAAGYCDPEATQTAPFVFDVTGSPTHPYSIARSVDRLEIIAGNDPPLGSEPNYQPRDFYFDNYTVLGGLVVECPGDINDDGTVDGADLGLLLGAWGTNDPVADLNGSGIVDGADLGILLGAWGACPE